MTEKNIVSNYKPEIDGIRAFAVIAVIINHFNKELLPSGYLGVDIFFVISGYVITSSLIRRKSANFLEFITNFYSRRIKRIIPALIFFVIVMGIFITLFNATPKADLRTGLASLFGFSNLYLLRQSVDYFDFATELSGFAHTWSLGVEEQFYFIFPIIFWVSGLKKDISKFEKSFFLIMIFLTTVSLISFIHIYRINQPYAYFLMPTRFWEIASGSILFMLTKKKNFLIKKVENIQPLIILILMILTLFLPISFGLITTISMVFLSSLLIICLKKNTLCFRLLTNQAVVFIGLMSYSLYLWHWGILTIARWTIGIDAINTGILIALIFLISFFSYEYIEKQFRNLNIKKTHIFSIGITSIILGSISINILERFRNFLFLGDINLVTEWGAISGSKINSKCYTNGNDIKNNLRRCSINYSKGILNQKEFILLGDSHARAHVFLGNYLAKKEEGIFRFIRCDNVAFPPLILSKSNKALENYECGRRLLNFIVKNLNSKQVIILSARWQTLFFEDYPDLSNLSKKSIQKRGLYPNQYYSNSALSSFLNDLNFLLRKSDKVGSKVVILDSLPEFSKYRRKPVQEYGSLCSNQWFNKGIRARKPCFFEKGLESRNFLLTRKKDFSETILSLKNKYRTLIVFNQFDILCPPGNVFCETESKNGENLFLDDDHISHEASLKIGKELYKELIE